MLDPYDFVKVDEQSVKRQEIEMKLALIGQNETVQGIHINAGNIEDVAQV